MATQDIGVGRFTGQLNGFYGVLENFVGSVEVPSPDDKFTVQTSNVAEIRGWGIEFIGSLQITNELSLSAKQRAPGKFARLGAAPFGLPAAGYLAPYAFTYSAFFLAIIRRAFSATPFLTLFPSVPLNVWLTFPALRTFSLAAPSARRCSPFSA